MATENENWKLFKLNRLHILACLDNKAVFFHRDGLRSIWYRTPESRVVKVKFESKEKAERIFLKLTETMTFKSII